MRSGKQLCAGLTARRQTQNGVTLVETLVALGIFAVAASAVGRFLSEEIRNASSNHLASNAYALGEQEMENVRMLNYDEMVSREFTKTIGPITYTVATEVTANSPAPNMKAIRVTVSWTEPRGDKNVALHTIYTSIKR
jgi:prepilin-type N-terminal cleavage/methylation domain-containing protein